MSRKPLHGTRSPSTRLNDTVNQLSDGEFEDVVALFGFAGKAPKWYDLIVWHRGKLPYIPEEEKAEFQGYALNSLRPVALRRLDEAVNALRSELPSGLHEIATRLDRTSREELAEALISIETSKAHAKRRCYLERLLKLVILESSILGVTCSSPEREAELMRIDQELQQAQANLVLAPQIAYYRNAYWEKVIEVRKKTGMLDVETIQGYLNTDFAKIDVAAYPPLLMSEKKGLDEVFHALHGDRITACRIAESVWEQDQQLLFLSPLSRAQLMVRLNDHYVALGMKSKGEKLIAEFAALDPEAPQNRVIYLLRFFVAMLEWVPEGGLDNALTIFERNEEFLLGLPVSGNRSLVLIAVMVAYLGKGQGERAKSIFENLYRVKDQKPPLLYRISALICHLMILYDAHEVAEIKHYAKNYREMMLEKGEFSVPAIHLLGFLQKNARRHATAKPTPKVANAYKSELEGIIACLEAYEREDATALRLFYAPFLNWLRGKQAQKLSKIT